MGPEAIALVTWISIAVLGPGAVAVFLWFAVDMRRLLTSGRLKRRK